MIFKASSIASPPGPGPSLYSHACVRKEKNILEIMSTWCQFWLGMHGTGSKIIHLMRPQIEFVEPKTGWSTALNPRFTSNGGWVFKSLCYVQLNLYGGSYHGLAMWGAECKHTAKAIMFGKATNWRVGFDWWMRKIFHFVQCPLKVANSLIFWWSPFQGTPTEWFHHPGPLFA